MKSVQPYAVGIVYLVGLVVLIFTGAATIPFVTFAVIGGIVSLVFFIVTVAVQMQEKVAGVIDRSFNEHPSNTPKKGIWN